MSSWADIAAKNAPPPAEQPQPDQSLLEGGFEGSEPVVAIPEGESGVVVAPHDFKEHPVTTASLETPETVERDAAFAAAEREKEIAAEVEREYKLTKEYAAEQAAAAKEVVQSKTEEAKKELKKGEKFAEKEYEKAKKFTKKEAGIAKEEAVSIYNTLKYQLSRPQVFVPLIGALDAALLGFLSYRAYLQRENRIPFDRRLVSSVAVGLGAIFSLEAFGANAYFSKRDYYGNRKL